MSAYRHIALHMIKLKTLWVLIAFGLDVFLHQIFSCWISYLQCIFKLRVLICVINFSLEDISKNVYRHTHTPPLTHTCTLTRTRVLSRKHARIEKFILINYVFIFDSNCRRWTLKTSTDILYACGKGVSFLCCSGHNFISYSTYYTHAVLNVICSPPMCCTRFTSSYQQNGFLSGANPFGILSLRTAIQRLVST